jgi:hypothetical protein
MMRKSGGSELRGGWNSELLNRDNAGRLAVAGVTHSQQRQVY